MGENLEWQDNFGSDQEECLYSGINSCQALLLWRSGGRILECPKKVFRILSKELTPLIQRQATNMHSPVDVERQVASIYITYQMKHNNAKLLMLLDFQVQNLCHNQKGHMWNCCPLASKIY